MPVESVSEIPDVLEIPIDNSTDDSAFPLIEDNTEDPDTLPLDIIDNTENVGTQPNAFEDKTEPAKPVVPQTEKDLLEPVEEKAVEVQTETAKPVVPQTEKDLLEPVEEKAKEVKKEEEEDEGF